MNSTEQHFDAIFCQSFGPRKNEPGMSNFYLAACILRVYNFYKNAHDCHVPLIIQKDCADAFTEDIKIDKIISQHRNPNTYLDSYEVSRQCAEFCTQKGFKTVLVFAHPDHIWRVMKTLKKLGLNAAAADTSGTPYDPKSIQPWTRSRLRFLIREKAVIIWYFLKGKI
ncbi:MAG: hypothetical protein WCW61_01180 [Patescibacteria group bacterium]